MGKLGKTVYTLTNYNRRVKYTYFGFLYLVTLGIDDADTNGTTDIKIRGATAHRATPKDTPGFLVKNSTKKTQTWSYKDLID